MANDVCIKSGSYCPVCRGAALSDCRHSATDFPSGSWIASAEDREHLSIGRAINDAAKILPQGAEIRIDIERDSASVYWLDKAHGAWRLIDCGDLFSTQIRAAIKCAHGITGGQA